MPIRFVDEQPQQPKSTIRFTDQPDQPKPSQIRFTDEQKPSGIRFTDTIPKTSEVEPIRIEGPSLLQQAAKTTAKAMLGPVTSQFIPGLESAPVETGRRGAAAIATRVGEKVSPEPFKLAQDIGARLPERIGQIPLREPVSKVSPRILTEEAVKLGLDPVTLATIFAPGVPKIARGKTPKVIPSIKAKPIPEPAPPKPVEPLRTAKPQPFTKEEISLATRQLSKPQIEPPPSTIKTETPTGKRSADTINLERLDVDTNVEELITRQAETFKPEITKQRRGKISFAEQQKLADEIGITPEKLKQVRPGTAFNTEETIGIRNVLKTESERASALGEAIRKGDNSTKTLIEYRAQLERQRIAQKVFAGARAEQARSLGAGRILAKGIPDDIKAQEEMLKALGGRDLTEEIAFRLSKIDRNDPVAVNKFIRDVGQVKKIDQVYFYWVNSILSNPKTQIVNFVSNAYQSAFNPVARTFAAATQIPKALAGKQRSVLFGEAPAEVLGKLSGMSEGVRKWFFTMRNGISESAITKFDTRPTPIKGKAGAVIGVPGRLLVAFDDFFKAINGTGEKFALSYRQAAKEGLKGKSFFNRIGDLLNNTPDDILKASVKASERQTFQQELGKVGKIISEARKIPGGRWIVPFLRTPTNIFKEAFAQSPAGFISAIGKTGEAKAMALGRASAGSMLAYFFAQKALEGKLTGSVPLGKNESDRFFNIEQKQPQSIKVGDKWISYGRLEPLNTVGNLIGDAFELWRTGRADDETLSQTAVQAGKVLARSLANRTFLRQVSDIMNAMEDPARFGSRPVSNILGGFIPFSGLTGNIARSEETVRQAKGVKQQLQARIPGLSQQLPERTTSLGEPAKRAGTTAERLFSPFPVKTIEKDPVREELGRLGVSPGFPGKKREGLKLTDEESRILVKESGTTLKTALGNLFNSQSYQKLSDTGKIKKIKSFIEKSRKRAFKQQSKNFETSPKKRVFDETMERARKFKTKEERRQFLIRLNRRKEVPKDVLKAVAKRVL